MREEFKESEKYLTSKQQGDVDRFFESGTTVGLVHTNADGVARRVTFLRLPKGAKAPWTVKGVREDAYGVKERVYNTMWATGGEPVVAIGYVDMESGEKGSCNGNEWLKWLGEAPIIQAPPDDAKPTAMDKYVANKIKALEGGGIKRLGAEEYDDLNDGEGAKFRSPMNKK